jgi:hypothetical protein
LVVVFGARALALELIKHGNKEEIKKQRNIIKVVAVANEQGKLARKSSSSAAS